MMPRLGPRPMPLHLTAAMFAWSTSIAAWPFLKSGWRGWNLTGTTPASDRPSPDGASDQTALDAVVEGLSRHSDAAVAAAIWHAVLDDAHAFADAMLAYRRHPYRRDLPTPPIVWQRGTTRLLDFGPADARPLLVIPSLVNRAYILDLRREASFLRWLAARGGVRPLLIDWGAPGREETQFDLSAYMAERLEPALEAAIDLTGRRPAALGYCMGGTLLAALAYRRGSDLADAVFCAAPWDFYVGNKAAVIAMADAMRAVLPLVQQWGALPVDALQALFLSLDPLLGLKKFKAFCALDPAGSAAVAFVALEDWLNDGVPLAAPTAVDCIIGWYGENQPARGTWSVLGDPVDPGAIPTPSLHVVPSRDRIVPPDSALALADAMTNADVLRPPLGHIGMMVGRAAPDRVWTPIAERLEAS